MQLYSEVFYKHSASRSFRISLAIPDLHVVLQLTGSTPSRRIAKNNTKIEIRTAIIQWIIVILCLIFDFFLDGAVPHHSYIYHDVQSHSDAELWKYSYPLNQKQHVPPLFVPFISILTPVCMAGIWYLLGKIPARELHHSALVVSGCVVFTGLVTNIIKINVGRPRPNFVARCWPSGNPQFTATGHVLCEDSILDVDEGFKSFPSGHTSWSTSGLGYLSFWLLGKLRVFVGEDEIKPHKLMLALMPILGAALIGASRLQDNWHHPEDVAAGFFLGMILSWLFYRTLYPSCMSQEAGLMRKGTTNLPSSASLGSLELMNGVQGDLRV